MGLEKTLGKLTGDAGAVVGAEHDTHFDEPGRVLWHGALEPQQADDISHTALCFHEIAHADTVVGWFLATIVADGRDNVRGDPHLK